MENSNFFPWNLQYLGGGLVSLVTTFVVFRREPKTVSYRCFLMYGVSLVVWMFAAFLARDAPSLDSSTAFYRVVNLFFMVVQPLLLLTIVQIGTGRNIHYLLLVPAAAVGMYVFVAAPFDITLTQFGWAYSFKSRVAALITATVTVYAGAIVVTLLVLALKTKLLYLRRKYGLMLIGFFLYFIPLMVTNLTMWRDPNVRPIGGFLLIIEFLFMAYAFYLKAGKIEFAGGQASDSFNDSFFKFVQRLREVVPGTELGGDAAYFKGILNTTGLNKAILDNSSRQIFDLNLSSHLDMREVMNDITAFMRKELWALQASKEYAELFVEFYRKMRQDSPTLADAWLGETLKVHGGFLDKQGVLTSLSFEARLPPIFKELPRGKVSLLWQEDPVQAYSRMNQALGYGFEGICITKQEPRKVRATYGVERASVFWMTFQETPTEEMVSPNDFEQLSNIISLGVANSSRTVILFDCFDQIVQANPLERVRGMLEGLKKSCQENAASFLISINPDILNKNQIEAIEEELAKVR